MGLCLSYGTYPILCCNIYLCNGLLSPQIINSLYTWHCIPSTYHGFIVKKTLSTHVGWIDSYVALMLPVQDPALLWRKLISGAFFFFFLNNVIKLFAIEMFSFPNSLQEDVNQILLHFFIDLL